MLGHITTMDTGGETNLPQVCVMKRRCALSQREIPIRVEPCLHLGGEVMLKSVVLP